MEENRVDNAIRLALIIGLVCGIVMFWGINNLIELAEQKPFLIIYVAGPYWDDTHEGRTANTYNAIDAGIDIYYKCQYAIIPHMGHWIDPRMTELGYPERPNSFWYVLDNMILPEADIFLKLGNSRGTNAEAALANELGIPIVYSVNDIPDNCPAEGYKAFYDGSKIGV